VLSDRGTWLALKNDLGDLTIVVEGDKRLFDQYAVILVNPAKHPKRQTGWPTTVSSEHERPGCLRVVFALPIPLSPNRHVLSLKLRGMTISPQGCECASVLGRPRRRRQIRSASHSSGRPGGPMLAPRGCRYHTAPALHSRQTPILCVARQKFIKLVAASQVNASGKQLKELKLRTRSAP